RYRRRSCSCPGQGLRHRGQGQGAADSGSLRRTGRRRPQVTHPNPSGEPHASDHRPLVHRRGHHPCPPVRVAGTCLLYTS
ncbi:hypothetical protein DT384_16350, partial [Pseudomonas aeruginosa]